MFLLLLLASAAAGAEPVHRFGIFMRDGLRFDPVRVKVAPGELLSIEVTNADSTDMPHNFTLLRPGTREAVVARAGLMGADGPANGYVPQSPDIIAHTPLLAPNAGTVLQIRAPATPGVYPYVCTFPGHGYVMYGAMYVGIDPPSLDRDHDIPPTAAQTTVAGGGQRPFVQRIFMPDAGPAAIAVALPGNENYCWDAGSCRVRYAWQGIFLDASENWAGNGRALAVVPGLVWWRAAENDFPFRFGGAAGPAPRVKFLGYRTRPAGPEFHYRADGTEIFESIEQRPSGPGLVWHFRIPTAPEPVFYRTFGGAEAHWTASAGTWQEGTLRLDAAAARDFSLVLTSPRCLP